MLPTKQQQEQLAKQSKLIDLAEPWYINRSNNYKFIIERIFWLKEWNTKIGSVDMRQLLVETGIYSSVSWAYSDVIGSNSAINSEEVRKFVESYIASNSVAVKIVGSKENQGIQIIPAGSFYSHIENWKKIWNEIKIYSENKWEQEKYAFIRTFYPWKNENKLYKITWINTLEWAKEVVLSTIEATSLLQEIEQTGLSREWIYIVQKWERFFEKIQKLADSIDRKVNELEMEFYRHIDSYVLLNGINIPENAITNGRIDKTKLWKMFFSDNEQADIKFITNNNPMIDKAMDYMKKDIERISSITKVPLEFLWEQISEWAVGSESRQLRMSLFYAKVLILREALEEAYSYFFSQKSFTWWPIIGYETNQDTWTSTNSKTSDTRDSQEEE